MKEYIKNVLVSVHANCRTDEYGQMPKHNLSMYSLFKSRAEEVETYLKTNPILEVSTYGGRGGTYRAVTSILDFEIRRLCGEAFTNNLNRLQNVNRW